jgi:hypothetical protein
MASAGAQVVHPSLQTKTLVQRIKQARVAIRVLGKKEFAARDRTLNIEEAALVVLIIHQCGGPPVHQRHEGQKR